MEQGTMRWIAKMPTRLERDVLKDICDSHAAGAHESLLRSYHILNKVEEMLRDDVRASVILDCIDVMRNACGSNE